MPNYGFEIGDLKSHHSEFNLLRLFCGVWGVTSIYPSLGSIILDFSLSVSANLYSVHEYYHYFTNTNSTLLLSALLSLIGFESPKPL